MVLVSKVLFPSQAHGNLIVSNNNKIIGSKLIGQNFTAPQHFQSRPSTSRYDLTSSGGSNLGPTNSTLLGLVANRTSALREAGVTGTISSDLIMASGSGLDPHICLDSALVQVPAVAKARNPPEEELKKLVFSESINFPFMELMLMFFRLT